jgi:hypothetical protein
VPLLIAAAATPAPATQQGTLVIRNWAEMDKCNREAQAAFPDYSAESYAKRDAQVKACLARHNLPPREPVAPSK